MGVTSRQAMKTGYFDAAELSDIGRKRKNNEDACLAIPEQGVFCVADGMGGVMGGDLASEAVTTSIREAFLKRALDTGTDLKGRIRILRSAVNNASKWIKNFADEKVIGQMGSTVAALVFDPANPTRAVSLHAGDSRLYLFRDRQLKLLTTDHTAVAALAAKLGRPPDSLPAKYQNELLRAVGLAESVELELTPIEVHSGDLFLLCTDGLTRMVPNERLAALLEKTDGEPLEVVAKALVDAANEAGGKDNITVVLVKIGDLSGLPVLPETSLEEEGEPTAAPTTTDTHEAPCPPTPTASPPASDTDPTLSRDTPRTDSLPPAPAAQQSPKKHRAAPTLVGQSQERSPVQRVSENFVSLRPELKSTEPLPAQVHTTVSQHAECAAESMPRRAKRSKAVTGATILLASIIAVYVGRFYSSKLHATKRQASYQTIILRAQTELANGNLELAQALAEEALRLQPSDAEASRLWSEAFRIAQQRAQEYREKLDSAQALFEKQEYTAAMAHAEEALRRKPNAPEAVQLRQQIQAKLQALEAAQQQEQQYQVAVQAAQDLLDQHDYPGAISKADEALSLKPNGTEAITLKRRAQARLEEQAAAQLREELYRAAVSEALALFHNQEYIAALAKADEALRFKVDGSEAAQLRQQAQAKLKEIQAEQQREQQYRAAVQAGKELLERQDFRGALVKAKEALSLKPTGVEAMDLQHMAQSRLDEYSLDVEMETMLVWFNVLSPTDRYLRTTEAKRGRPLSGELGFDQRERFLNDVKRLEDEFRKRGWLDQRERARYLRKLRDTIMHRE